MKLTKKDKKFLAGAIIIYGIYHFSPYTPVVAIDRAIDKDDGYKKITVELYMVKKEDVEKLKKEAKQ